MHKSCAQFLAISQTSLESWGHVVCDLNLSLVIVWQALIGLNKLVGSKFYFKLKMKLLAFVFVATA